MVGCCSPPGAPPLPRKGRHGRRRSSPLWGSASPRASELGASDDTQPRGLGSEAGVCRGAGRGVGQSADCGGRGGDPRLAKSSRALTPVGCAQPAIARIRRHHFDRPRGVRIMVVKGELLRPRPPGPGGIEPRGSTPPPPPPPAPVPFRTADSARPLAVNRGGSCGLAGGPLGNQPLLHPERV